MMSRKSHDFRPTVDGNKLEERIALSGFGAFRTPVLTSHTYDQVVRSIDTSFKQYVGSYGGAFAQQRLQAQLQQLSYRIPYGGANLAPGVPGVLSGITPFNAGAAYHQVRANLQSYVQSGVLSRAFAFHRS